MAHDIVKSVCSAGMMIMLWLMKYMSSWWAE